MMGQETACKVARTYQSRDIETADPISRVVRVFELASTHLTRARVALRNQDPAAKGKAIQKVSACLHVLQTSLDMERGEAVSRNLDRIYSYYQVRLTEAHLRNDDTLLEEIGNGLTELVSAWRQALRSGDRDGDGRQQVQGAE